MRGTDAQDCLKTRLIISSKSTPPASDTIWPQGTPYSIQQNHMNPFTTHNIHENRVGTNNHVLLQIRAEISITNNQIATIIFLSLGKINCHKNELRISNGDKN